MLKHPPVLCYNQHPIGLRNSIDKFPSPSNTLNFKMFKHILFLATAVVAAIVVPGDAPDPSQVSIRGITYAGSGCPANSVGQFLSTDAST
jgi:hypothetical protein